MHSFFLQKGSCGRKGIFFYDFAHLFEVDFCLLKSQISLSTFAPIKAFIEKRDVGDPDPIYISYPDSIFGLY